MTEKPGTNYFSFFIKLLVVLCLADGFTDLSIYTLRLARAEIAEYSARHAPKDDAVHELYRVQRESEMTMPHQYIAGIGLVPRPAILPGFSIGADGQRLVRTGNSPAANVNGLLLGASQAFGIGDSDDQTLSAAMGRILPEVNVSNYAVHGHRIVSNVMYWQSLAERGKKFDFVLIVNGAVDVLYHCLWLPDSNRLNARNSNATPPPALGNAYEKALSLVSPSPPLYPQSCGDNAKDVSSVVNRIIYDLKGAQAFARERRIPLAIVIPPSPYGNRANVSTLTGDPFYRDWKPILTPVVSALRRRLKENPLPGVYDLSDAFDGKAPYFLDSSAHMTGQGQEVLAQAIVNRVGKAFFAAREKHLGATP